MQWKPQVGIVGAEEINDGHVRKRAAMRNHWICSILSCRQLLSIFLVMLPKSLHGNVIRFWLLNTNDYNVRVHTRKFFISAFSFSVIFIDIINILFVHGFHFEMDNIFGQIILSTVTVWYFVGKRTKEKTNFCSKEKKFMNGSKRRIDCRSNRIPHSNRFCHVCI